jgi:hypothetical protein
MTGTLIYHGPSNPNTIPTTYARLGDFYIDSTNGILYVRTA